MPKMPILDLFAALKSGDTDAELLAIIAASPGAAKEKGEKEMLPLHCAIASGASEAVVLALLLAYPEAAKEKDDGERLPLHCAVANGASEAVVLAVLQAYPEAVKEKDEEGKLPLQWAVYETDYIKATEVEGESKEAGAKVIYEGRAMVVSRGVDNDGDLKLKPAVDEEVVLALLQAYTEAAKEKDEDNKLPLHYAVSNGASEAVVLALLLAYPEAAKEWDKYGMLPLHCAVGKGASEAVVLAVLHAYPEAAKERDQNEKLPLHIAVDRWSASEAVVLAVLQAYPEAAQEKDEKEMLPLHCAIASGASEAVVLTLLQAYPEAAQERGEKKTLPLHCAIASGASEAVVLTVLQAYPEAAKEKGEKEMLPLHCAGEMGASKAVVLALLQAYPEAVKERRGRWYYPPPCGDKNGSTAGSTAECWWKYGGGDLEPVLASSAVAAVDAQWIINHAEQGGVLTHRQALPEEAFLSLPELIEATRPFQGLPVAALSYPWLTKDHPDPNGDNLRRVAQALKALLSGPNAFRRLGVFWDFLSLHQHPDPANGVVRTEEQNTLFKQGLGCLGTLYSHPQTTVLRLTSLPAGHKEDQLMGANVAKYFDRGWCFTEASWASLTKNGKKSLDLSKMRDDKEYVCGSLVTECTKGGGRRPPLLPSRFAAELETKSFTNGKDDKPLVQRLYEAAFEEQFGKAEELDYGHLGWGDAEAAQLAEVLASGAAPWLMKLELRFNQIGDEGCKALAAALKEGAAPSLQVLLMGSNSPELDAVCRDRGITLTAVAGVVAPSEASLLERG